MRVVSSRIPSSSTSSTLNRFRAVSLLILLPLFIFFLHQQHQIIGDIDLTVIEDILNEGTAQDDGPSLAMDDFDTSVQNMIPSTTPLWKAYLQSKLDKKQHIQQPVAKNVTTAAETSSVTIIVTADVHGQVLHRSCQEPETIGDDEEEEEDQSQTPQVDKKNQRKEQKTKQKKGKIKESQSRSFEESFTSCVFPGSPYVSYVAKTIRKHEKQQTSSSVVLLDVGDAAFGSGQFDADSAVDEAQLVAATMNRLQYSAMALGNHELDLGRPKLQNFVDQVQFPILAANVDWGSENDEQRDNAVHKGFAPQVQIPLGTNNDVLCLLGLTANEPNPLAGPNVHIKPELETWRTQLQAALLSSTNNCTRTILMSHAGIGVDRQLEQELSAFNQQYAPRHQVDVILGAHSHILLPSQLPDDRAPEYPIFGTVQNNYHHPAATHAPRLLHVGANGRYVGLLKISWDSSTKKMTNLQTGVLPLDRRHGVQPDPEFFEWQMKWMEDREKQQDQSPQSEKRKRRKRIRTSVFVPSDVTRLCGQDCRTGPCMLGQIVSDSMRFCVEQQDKCGATEISVAEANSASGFSHSAPSFRNDTRVIALLESGTLRNCLDVANPNFYKVLTWPNTMVLLQLKGSLLREFLQHGIASETGGGWLQTSGLHYKTSTVPSNAESKPQLRQDASLWLEEDRPMLKPRYSAPLTPTEAKLRGSADRNQTLTAPQLAIRDEELYWVVVTDWLASGGDAYAPLVEKASQKIYTNITLYEAIAFSHPKKLSAQRVAARGAVSGFLGGYAAFFATFPIYTFFVRKSQNRPLVCGWSIFNGVWLGALATAISDALYFMMYESSFLFDVSPLVGSILAATINSLATSPLWVIVTQQQLLTLQMSIWNVMKSVYKTKGLWGFFDTLPFNLLLCSYPVIRQMALRLLEDLLGLEGSLQIAVAASMASIVATVVTFPIQKWRVHLQSGSHENIWHHLSCCFFFRGVEFKIVDTIIKNFVLFFVKKQSDDVLNMILDG